MEKSIIEIDVYDVKLISENHKFLFDNVTAGKIIVEWNLIVGKLIIFIINIMNINCFE